jgi:hypothetical protein
MSNKLSNCEQLYKEYKQLLDETNIVVQDYRPGEKLVPQSLDLEKVLRRESLKNKILTECRDYIDKTLTPEEIFLIENN